MPVQKCTKDGKPGYKWGEQGYCYTYSPGSDKSEKRAKRKAADQGRAIKASKSAVLFFICFILSSCLGGFSPREVVQLPDAPVLIREIRGDYADVYGWSPETGAMIRVGWVELKKYEGWTISKYDWATHSATRKTK